LSTVTTDGEIHNVVNPLRGGSYTADGLPYGLGPRVPMTVVSPWTKGGFVCSQVFDHTSVIRFIEARFGVHEPNITAWRRAVCGDLTSAFNFRTPDASMPSLPDTSNYKSMADNQCSTQPAPAVPVTPGPMDPQETGTRPTRPLPYELHVNGQLINRTYSLTFANTGQQGAHFWVYTSIASAMPRRYTVEAGKQLTDVWALDANGQYWVTVYGPNGFFRRFSGSASADAAALLELVTCYDVANGNVYLTLSNNASTELALTVADSVYGQPPRTLTVPAGKTVEDHWDLSCSSNWYDLQVTVATDAAWLRRIAGHVETGKPGLTDPAATAPVTQAL
jgi:phospholipase C